MCLPDHDELSFLTNSVAGTEANASVASVIAVTVLSLPTPIRAGLFDPDGVLTQTATVHAAAWKEMFDSFLKGQAAETDMPFVAFDTVADRGDVDETDRRTPHEHPQHDAHR